MQITDLSESKKQIKINIDKDHVLRERNSIINHIRQEARIDGFRRGKIPLEILKQRFKDVIDGRLTQNLIYETSEKILKEQNWNFVGSPEVKDVIFNEDGSLDYEITVEIIPVLDIKNYSNLKLQKNASKISEGEIDEVLKNLQKRHAEFVPVSGRGIKDGDIAVIDFTAFHKNNPIKGGSSKGFTLRIGSKEFFPEVENKLIGSNIGDEKEILAMFPDDYADKKLKGQEVLFKIKVNDIREEKLPEINDVLAEKCGNLKNLEELKINIQRELTETKEKISNINLKKEARKQLALNNQFDPPEFLIEKKIDDILRETEANLRYKGIELKNTDNIQNLRNTYRENAKTQVKASLVLREIAARENIAVSPLEIDEEIRKIAQALRKNVNEIKDMFKEKNLLPVIEEDIKEEKALDFVISKAEIKEEEVNK
ncbi:MAG: trigger factor [bacterium]